MLATLMTLDPFSAAAANVITPVLRWIVAIATSEIFAVLVWIYSFAAAGLTIWRIGRRQT